MTNFYKTLLPVFLGLSSFFLSAQNQFSVAPVTVGTETGFQLSIDLENQENIEAVQFDIYLNKDVFILETGHTLTVRAANHDLAVNTIAPGVIRIIIYATDGSLIAPGTGKLVDLNLRSKNLPGSYTASISNLIVSDADGNSLSASSQNSTLTITGPQLDVVTTAVEFGRVPLGSSPTRNLTVRNRGNETLTINSVSEITPFSVQQSFPINIPAGQSTTLTIAVNTAQKQKISRELKFNANDPDPLRKLQKSVLSADIYAVNEIYVGTGSGEINTEVTIPVEIKNMEPFTGFQFDITLPTDITYVPNSVVNSARSNGHSISANMINANTLRFIGYSSSNEFFSGNDGQVFSFKLKPKVSSGNYPLPVSNAIISHPEMGDILSDVYGGSITIDAPNLYIYPSTINFGSVPVTETRTQSIRLSNYGTAPLIIDTLLYDRSQLDLDATLPIEIPSNSKDFLLTFTPIQTGDFSEKIILRHNGSTEQNIISVSAQVFSPNYLLIKNQDVFRNDTTTVELALSNNDGLRAIQFDVKFPAGFIFDKGALKGIDRISGFSISSSEVSENLYRIIVFSESGAVIVPGEAPVLQLPVFISETVALGSYTLDLTNVILSDNNYEDIKSAALKTGQINVIEDTTPPEAICQNITVQLDVNGQATITAAQIDNGSVDSDSGIASLQVSKDTFTSDELGENIVTLTVTDNQGNEDSCTATVTVKEAASNYVLVTDQNMNLGETTNVSLQLINNEPIKAVQFDIELPAGFDPDLQSTSATDRISGFSKSVSLISGNKYRVLVYSTSGLSIASGEGAIINLPIHVTSEVALGNYTPVISGVLLSDLDNQNAATTPKRTGTLTVIDTIAPSAVCKNLTVQLDVNGQANITAEQIDNGSKDASGIASLSLSQTAFSIEHVGTNEVTLTVTDNNGNTNTCIATVTVEDNVAPEAICQNITVQLDANGQATITAEQIDNGSNDASGIASLSLSQSAFSVEHIGANEVTLTVTDNNGNTNTCIATVTVEDKVVPEAVCQNITVQLDANGQATISAEQIDNGSNDASGIASLTVVPATFSMENIGTNEVTLTVTDNNGNNNTCTATVTVEDKVVPEAVCQNISVQLDANGQATITAEQIDNGSNDASGIASLSLSQSAFSVEHIGANEVTLTVTDNNGNNNNCIATVTVEDKVVPEAVCQNITVQLDANGQATITAEQINNGSYDASGIASLSLSQSAFSVEHIGANEVTLTVTDNNGNTNTCTATVTVEDKVVPEAVCQNISVQLDANGQATITEEQIDNGSNDASGIASLTVVPATFSMENIGTNEVTLTVTDNSGNSNSCTATVTVKEPASNFISVTDQNMNLGETTNVSLQLINNEPIKAVQFDIDLPAGFEPDLEAAAATERISGFSKSISLVSESKYRVLVYSTSGLSIASGEGAILNLPVQVNSEVALGTYTPVISGVLLSDLDNQNAATTPKKIGILTVVDTIAPEALCQNITVQLDANGQATITEEQIDNGSNDASGIASLTLSQSSFSVEHIGSNEVTLSVTDNNGNTSTCTSSVIVEDNVAPVAGCQNVTVQLDANGQATITAEQINNGSKDASGIASLSTSPSSFAVEQVGANEVILTVTDNNGNTSTCVATVTVEDNVAPEAVCKNVTLQLDINGEITITAEQIDNGSSDAAGIASMTLSPSSFTIDNLGENTVTLTVQDSNGNTSTCTSAVTIIEYDETPPVPDEPVLQDIVAECEILNIPVPTATDNVDGNIQGNTNAPLIYKEQGTYTITWLFEDANGNFVTQEQNVIIQDLTEPVVEVKEVTRKLKQGDVIELEPQELDNGSSDNCGEIILTLDRTTFDSVGEYTVELTATDAAGNQSSKPTTVIIEHDIQPEKVHLVPTLIEKGSAVKVYVPLGTGIKEVHVIETETNRFKTFPGNNQDVLELNVAPLTGTLLVKIIDGNDKSHFKKLIVL